MPRMARLKIRSGALGVVRPAVGAELRASVVRLHRRLLVTGDDRALGVDDGDRLAVKDALGDLRRDATEDARAGVDDDVRVDLCETHRITRTLLSSGFCSTNCSSDTASPAWSIFVRAVPRSRRRRR